MPGVTNEALQAFAVDNQTSQVSSTRTLTRRQLIACGFSKDQADVLVPKGRQGRLKADRPTAFPGLSKKAAEAIADAIGLDEYEGEAIHALEDVTLWDSLALEEARKELFRFYRTTASAQKAYKILLAGLKQPIAGVPTARQPLVTPAVVGTGACVSTVPPAERPVPVGTPAPGAPAVGLSLATVPPTTDTTAVLAADKAPQLAEELAKLNAVLSRFV